MRLLQLTVFAPFAALVTGLVRPMRRGRRQVAEQALSQLDQTLVLDLAGRRKN